MLVAAGGCNRAEPVAPPTSITIVTGGSGGSFAPISASLARIYSTRLPGVQASGASSTITAGTSRSAACPDVGTTVELSLPRWGS